MNIDTILISEYASSDGFGRLTVVNAFNKLFGTGPKQREAEANGPQNEGVTSHEDR